MNEQLGTKGNHELPPLSIVEGHDGNEDWFEKWEEFWKQNEAEIKAGTETILPMPEKPKGMSNEEYWRLKAVKQMKWEKVINGEKPFSQKVIKVTDRMLDKHSKVIVLFDVDFNLACTDFDRFDQKDPVMGVPLVVRPSASHVMNYLVTGDQKDRVHIGLLTTKNRESVLAQLDSPAHLGCIGTFINRNLVFSCADLKDCEEWENYDEWRRKVDAKPEEIKNLYGPTGDDKMILDTWYWDPNTREQMSGVITLEKLKRLAEVRDEIKGAPLAIFDDLPFADYLDPEEKCYGASTFDCKFMLGI